MNASHHDERWRFLNSGFHTGDYNMRFDETLAHNLLSGDYGPILRIYGWKPCAVSLGYNQRRHDLDEEKCRRHGIDIVRRPTGGRAILHANELTYSVVMPATGRNINDVYGDISRALVCGLRLLGAEVEYATAQPNFRQMYRQQTSIPCFASSSKYEIQYQGRKLVGSAQRRYAAGNGREVVLQHGSLLLGPEHRQLHELLRLEEESIAATILHDLESKTTELSAVLGRAVGFEEAASAVRKGFELSWQINFFELNDDAAEAPTALGMH
jgi:lipoyl(octanoyl) transferase